jgi:tricorn protease
MWHGETLYLLSDRDQNKRANIWACDLKHDKFRQVTFFKEFDVHFSCLNAPHFREFHRHHAVASP